MRRSKRIRRRLIAASIVCLLLVGSALTFYMLRMQMREQTFIDARSAGLAAHESGEYPAALRHLSYYLANHKDDVRALVAYAEARSRVATPDHRHITEPIGLYNVVLDLEPDNERALEGVLLLYERTGRRAEWMTAAKQLLQLNPMHIDAIRLKAIGYSNQGRFDEAEHYVSRLIMLDPDEITWRLLHLQIRQSAGQPTEAILELCRQWIKEYEGDGRYYMLKSNVLATAGDRPAAREAARRAVERGASDSDVLQQLLSLLDVLRLSQEAQALIAATKQQHPEASWPNEAAIQRHWQQGRIGLALSQIDEIEQQHEALSTTLLRWKSMLFILDGNFADAKAALDELATRAEKDTSERDSIRAWIAAARARINLDDGAWQESLNAYNNALALDPNDPVIHYLLGEAYARVNENELAVQSLGHAVQSDPNWVAAQMMYLDALLHTNRHHEAAHLAANLMKRSDRPALRLHLQFARAWLSTNLSKHDIDLRHRGSGEPVTRMDYLMQLHEQFPDHPEVNELLVRAILMNGERNAAVAHLETVLAREASSASLYLALASLSEHAQLGYEDQFIKRAQAQQGLTLEVATAKARQLHRSGQTESGLALLRQAGEEAIGSAKREGADTRALARQIKREILRYRVWTNDPRAEQAVRSYLHTASNVEAAVFALDFPVTWEHRDLLDKAITMLEESVGATSPQAAIARTKYILRYLTDDDAAMANAMMMMNNVLHRTPDSVSALSLMAALYLAGESPQYDIAVHYLQRAVEAEPTRGELYPQLIALLQQQGDYPRARRYLDRMGRVPGLHHDLLRAQLELYEAQGDRDAIITQLSSHPAHQQTEEQDLLLFSALHRSGRHAEAEHVLFRLLDQSKPSLAVFAAATEYYGNLGQVQEAQRLIETRLLDHKPGDAALLLGRLHAKHGVRAEAERWLSEAIEMQPENAEGWVEMARFHLEQGEYEAAQHTATNGLRAAPYDARLRSLLAVITLNLTGAARDEAVELLEKHDHDCEALIAALDMYDRITSRTHPSKPTSQDLRDLRQFTRDYPDYIQGWRLAITAHAEAGDFERAYELAHEAIGRFPTNPMPAKLATNVLISQGQLESALDIAWIWRSRSLEMPLEADAVIAAIHLDLEQPSAAVSQLRAHIGRILAQHDRHPELVPLVLRSLIQSEQVDEASDLLEPILDKDDRLFETWIEATRMLQPSVAAHSLRRLEDALSERANALSSEAQLAIAQEWIRLGQYNRDDDFIATGRQQIAAMLHQDLDGTTTRSARLALASLATEQGDFDAAENHYRTILDDNARDWEVLRLLAELSLYRNGPEYAHTWSQRAHELQPDNLSVLKTHTRILLKLDRTDEAVELLTSQSGRLLRVRDHTPEGVQLWLRTLVLTNQWDHVQREITPLLQEDDRWAQFLLELSREMPSTMAATAIERAAETLTRTATGTLAVASEWAILGSRTGDTKHMINAMQLADRAQATSSSISTQAMLLQASIAERIGNDDAAAEHYRSALREDPGNFFALNNLAALLLRSGDDHVAEAIEHSERALMHAEEHPELLNTYARALLRAERYDEAEQYVQQALNRDGQHAAFYLTLSEIMFEKGEHEQARHWFREAEAAKDERKQHDPLLRNTFADVRSRIMIEE